MPRFPVLLTALALAGCAGTGLDLFGGSGPPGETAAVRETCPSFARYDADRSGWIEPAEFTGAGREIFTLWDDTDDALLSYNEFNDCVGAPAEDLFARIDNNGDRMISPEEFTAEALFAALDQDHNGRLDEAEFPFGNVAR